MSEKTLSAIKTLALSVVSLLVAAGALSHTISGAVGAVVVAACTLAGCVLIKRPQDHQ